MTKRGHMEQLFHQWQSIQSQSQIFVSSRRQKSPMNHWQPYYLQLSQDFPKDYTPFFAPWQLRDLTARCVRGGMTVVARAEAKGEYGRQGARWDYMARCAPPIFPSSVPAPPTAIPPHPPPSVVTANRNRVAESQTTPTQ